MAIKGDDFEVLKKISAVFKEYLVTVPGLKDVKDDYEDYKNELRVYVDEKTAAITGITVFDIATTIRSCFEGSVATTIKKTDEEIAKEVIEGKWGVDDDRIVRLTNAGYNASAVQRIVNSMLKEQMVTDEPEIGDKPKQILEVTIDLKKYGALVINLVN